MTTAFLILAGGAIAMSMVLRPGIWRTVCTGLSTVGRIERKHHVFSGAALLLLALVGIATVCGLLLMWVLRAYVDFFTF